jgi:hypothetical protein
MPPKKNNVSHQYFKWSFQEFQRESKLGGKLVVIYNKVYDVSMIPKLHKYTGQDITIQFAKHSGRKKVKYYHLADIYPRLPYDASITQYFNEQEKRKSDRSAQRLARKRKTLAKKNEVSERSSSSSSSSAIHSAPKSRATPPTTEIAGDHDQENRPLGALYNSKDCTFANPPSGNNNVLRFKGTRFKKPLLATSASLFLAYSIYKLSGFGSKSTRTKNIQNMQKTAIRDLKLHTGDGGWTHTPAGRRTSLRASLLTIPAKIVDKGLNETLSFIYHRKRLFYQDIVANAMEKYGNSKHSRQSNILDMNTIKPTNNLKKMRQQVLRDYPNALEVLFTSPTDGSQRSFKEVQNMLRKNPGLLNSEVLNISKGIKV